jgi:hypothetical protein
MAPILRARGPANVVGSEDGRGGVYRLPTKLSTKVSTKLATIVSTILATIPLTEIVDNPGYNPVAKIGDNRAAGCGVTQPG